MGADSTRSRAVAYVRVSTEKQADHGSSLEAQAAKLQQYAQLYDLEIVETVVDAGLSASTLDRAGLQRALGLLVSGAADALLVVKLDRLTRSVADLAELIEEYFAAGKWALLSVGEQIDTRSAAGRLVLNVLASVSQWEREAIGERTATVMQHKLARGEYTGGKPPYGKKLSACGRTADACAKAGGCDVAGVHGVLVDVPGELVVIAEARRLRGEGLALHRVGKRLAELGHVARSGRPFAAAQVGRMVAGSDTDLHTRADRTASDRTES